MIRSFHPTAAATKNITAGVASSNVNVVVGGATGGPIQVRVYNAGAVVAFIKQGSDNTVTASATADLPLAPGEIEVFTLNVPFSSAGGLWLAAITASSTATLYFTVGAGI